MHNGPTSVEPAPGLEQPDYQFNESHRALIIGAGLAGCAAASALAARGMRCSVLDQHAEPARATSSVPVAIYHPSSASVDSPEHHYFNDCFDTLISTLKPDAVMTQGLLQKTTHTVTSPHWSATELPASALSQRNPQERWLYCKDAGALEPAILCKQWLTDPLIDFYANAKVSSLHQTDSQWVASDNHRNTLASGDLVILANANAAAEFINEVPLTPVRGQLSCFDKQIEAPVICDRGYITPTATGLWAGATFQRQQTALKPLQADNQRNHRHCSQYYSVHPEPTQAWVGVRCTTPDRLPLIGAIPRENHYQCNYRELHLGRTRQQFAAAQFIQGMYAFVGLGSHGVVQALHGAKCLAEIIFADYTHASKFKELLHPARFLIRQLRKSPLNR